MSTALVPLTPRPLDSGVLAPAASQAEAAIESGAVFRSITRHGKVGARMSGYAVALVVKKYAGAVGLEPGGYSGHSLRAGLATSAAIAGASERAIMNQTGLRSAAMVRRISETGICSGRMRRRGWGFNPALAVALYQVPCSLVADRLERPTERVNCQVNNYCLN